MAPPTTDRRLGTSPSQRYAMTMATGGNAYWYGFGKEK